MRHQDELLRSQMFRQGADVLHQMFHLVLIEFGGLRRKIVAAHVGRDRQMVLGKLGELFFPRVQNSETRAGTESAGRNPSRT